jgi:2-keto-4-pentenoate hydratase/2-oxohepta-3-ene-1,7-dioic acid hydratase in catechol pathway
MVRVQAGEALWGVFMEGRVHPLHNQPATLQELLKSNWREDASSASARSPVADYQFLSPVTAPCQIICQGKNYLDHIIETGVKPKDKDFNLLFSKSDASLALPVGQLKRPAGVKLLDYEIELGLVIGKEISAGAQITEENLVDYVAGFVIANDVSARDVQICERQWFKGKSFRGFCPVGPILYLPDREEFSILFSLELRVNGEIRQKASTAQLIHTPAATLAEIAGIFDLRPGDLLLTGTPGGVAMRVKQKTWFEEFLGTFRSEKEKFARFVEEQSRSPRYLKPGDKIESTIHSKDGCVDLGTQTLEVV